MEGKSIYNNALNHAIARKLNHLLMNKEGLYIRGDGKIAIRHSFEWRGPWVYVPKPARWQQCLLWHKIMFDVVFDRRYIPSPCYDCYKVVAKPRTVSDLFAICDYQQKLNAPGKCGIEGDRSNTNRLYGAYWYCKGLENGLNTYEQVRGDLDDNIPVILKRGCTEYEQALGPSDQWEIHPDQLLIENTVNQAVVQDVWDYVQPDHVVAGIHAQWIEKAFQWGDPTYIEFTGGKPFHNPPVTYHDKEE